MSFEDLRGCREHGPGDRLRWRGKRAGLLLRRSRPNDAAPEPDTRMRALHARSRNMVKMNFKLGGGLSMRILIIGCGLVAVTAAAQQSQDPAAAADQPTIEQIIVTATRREETLLDVPLAVSAYDAERIELSRVTDIRDLMRISPSFHLSGGQAESVGVTARIRGVGTNSDNPGLESSVGMYVDGVYRNRATVGFTELGSIERIEVLRGPQGTLFGRNSSAGVVSVITALPDPDGSGYADLSVGSYGYSRLEAGLSGSVGGDTSARLDAVAFERDGFLDDVNLDRDYNNRDRTFVRGQILFEPSDTVRLRLIGDYSDRDEICCAAVGLIPGPAAQAIDQIAKLQTANPNTVGMVYEPYRRLAAVTQNSGYAQSVEESGISLEVDAELPFARLVSVTASRDWETLRHMDVDFTAMDLGARGRIADYRMGFETLTQELRLNGQAGRLDWLVGAYYSDEELPYQDALDFGIGYSPYANGIAAQAAAGIGDAFNQLGAVIPALEAGAAGIAQGAAGLAAGLEAFRPLLPPGFAIPTLAAQLPVYPGFPFNPWPGYERLAGGARLAGSGAVDTFDQESRSWALFTHNTFEFENDLELTLGLRYTSEDKSMSARLRSTDQVCLPFSQQLLGYLGQTQAYLQGVGAYAQGLQAYVGQLGALRQLLPQYASQIPPHLLPAVQQLSQAAAGIEAGAGQLLPSLPQVVTGGQAILANPDVQLGIGTIAALGCNPFSDPTRDGNYRGALDENEVSGTLRLSRTVRGGHLLYAGYSRGYKAGGFNMDRTGLLSPILSAVATGVPAAPSVDQWIFRPETVDAIELGGKFSLDNGLGLLDISLFQEEFQDYQLTAFRGFAFEALNIPEVTSKGVEIEARGGVTDNIELFGGITYADVRFGSGPEYDFRTGRQLTHAPKVTSVAGVTIGFPLGGMAGTFHIDARYTGEHNTGADLDAQKHQEAFTVVNARLILTPRDGASPWTVDLWVQNLTDEEYALTVFDAPLQQAAYNAFIGDPRISGLSVRYDF